MTHTFHRDYAHGQYRVSRSLPWRVSHRDRTLAEGTATLGALPVFVPSFDERYHPPGTGIFPAPLALPHGLAMASEGGQWHILVPDPDSGEPALSLAWSSPPGLRIADWCPDGRGGLLLLHPGGDGPGRLERWTAEDARGRSWRGTTFPLDRPLARGLVCVRPDGAVVALHRDATGPATLTWLTEAAPGQARTPGRLDLPADEVLGLWNFGPHVVAVLRTGEDSVVLGLALADFVPAVAWRHVVPGAVPSSVVHSLPLRGLQPDDRTLVTAVDHRVIQLVRDPQDPSQVTTTLRPLSPPGELSVGAILPLPAGEVLVLVARRRDVIASEVSLHRIDLASPPTTPPALACKPLQVLRNYQVIREWGALFDGTRLVVVLGNQVQVVDTADGWAIAFQDVVPALYRHPPLRLGDLIVMPQSKGLPMGLGASL